MKMFKKVGKIFPKKYKGLARRILYSLYGWRHIEEVELVSKFAKIHQRQGAVLDVGSHVGGSALFFLNMNLEVHCFEPSRNTFAILEDRLKGMPNYRLNQLAISSQTGKILDFYESDESKGISSLHNFRDSHSTTYQVSTIRLDDYIDKHSLKSILFLKIDVEGHEMNVLESICLDKNRPTIILFEFEDTKTAKLGYGIVDLIKLIDSYEYDYVISEWYPLKNYGDFHKWKGWKKNTEDIDPLAWGNVIAVDRRLDSDYILSEIKRLS